MLPMVPRLAEATDPVAALAERAERGPEPERRLLPRRSASLVAMEAADARAFRLPIQRVEIRRDIVASRRRWQFGLREEALLSEVP
jgi:CRISPR system Cascade subunit CasD